MRGRTRVRLLVSCTIKVPYATWLLAERARRALGYGRELVVYRCGGCGSWHLGHPGPRPGPRSRRRR